MGATAAQPDDHGVPRMMPEVPALRMRILRFVRRGAHSGDIHILKARRAGKDSLACSSLLPHRSSSECIH